MTKDEAREAAWNERLGGFHPVSGRRGMPVVYSDGFDDGYDFAKSEDRWIPVSERLPVSKNEQVKCIVSVKWSDETESVGLSGWWNDAGWAIEVKTPDARITAKVTAWMPRPEPYKESKK